MRILVTNDDGYSANGLQALVRVMRQFGSVTVIAPKYHQSGMAMAVSMGFKPIAVRELGVEDGVRWIYLDGTPASCVKFGIDNVFTDYKPDVVVSGINHGSNAATAACYSGTLGAAQEAAVNGIPGIGISLDNLHHQAGFDVAEKLLPDLFRKIWESHSGRFGVYYNINFPDLPAEEIKGVKVGHQGVGHWVDEYQKWDPEFFIRKRVDVKPYGLTTTEAHGEPGEDLYMMVGDFQDDPQYNDSESDHYLLAEGYITVTVHNIDTTDRDECARLQKVL